jgi:hypothetical protein
MNRQNAGKNTMEPQINADTRGKHQKLNYQEKQNNTRTAETPRESNSIIKPPSAPRTAKEKNRSV